MNAHAQTQSEVVSIHPATQIGAVTIAIADLARSLDFYTHAIGFQVIERTEGTAVLGAAGTPLLRLVAQPGARPKPRSATGLYHFAILVPSRADLSRSLARLLRAGHPAPGVGDHLVSEALYLSDPDGNGIELYRDRPRDGWTWQQGQVRMATLSIDLRELLHEADHDGQPDAGLPAGTRIGHIHLQVADIAEAERFYHGVLGFDVAARLPGALFVSAGGYHHHVGLNTWESRGGPKSPAIAAGLRRFTVELPDTAALAAVRGRLEAAGVAVTEQDDGVMAQDPWGNGILFSTETAAR